MKRKIGVTLIPVLAASLLMCWSYLLPAQDTNETPAATENVSAEEETPARVYTNKEDNEQCLKCHGQTHIEYKLEGQDKIYKQRMYTECFIDTASYYGSNHWNFKCIECHSDEYYTFPHKGELRFEEIPNCMDCHGGDPQYAEFNFDAIDLEFQKSVHFRKQGGSFSCWSCHDQHYYKINARKRKEDIRTAIQYDNDICLSCHANTKKYQLITDKLNPNIMVSHDWLPNQPNHFKHVRCIECHTEFNDTLMVAHNILPKSKAVKKCTECHTKDSRLMASLYKYQLENAGKLKLGKDGFMGNPVIIGGERNLVIKTLGNLAVLLTIAVVIVHFVLRLRKRKISHYES